ncbi:MAG: AAA family ATPase [Taibaiella sp.]|jgi:DNA repair exonuclease SbcCD ATPase subunit
MKLKSIKLKEFKRFKDLTIEGISPRAKLVILTGPNGSGKTSLLVPSQDLYVKPIQKL